MKFKITLVFVFSFTILFSQGEKRLDYKKEAKKGSLNYYQIIEKKKEEIKSYDLTKLSNKKAIKQFNRWAYFWKDRVDEQGIFPSANLGYYNAGVLDKNGKIVISDRNLSRSSSSNENWVNVGPQSNPDPNGYPNPPQMGRLNVLLRIKHPSDRSLDVLFVGAPNGGVWKSTDGGTTWSPKLDNVAGIGVTDIKTTPDATFANYTTKPIYVSTGDYDASQVSSIGVLKSTDGGENFASTGLSYSESEGKLLGQLIVKDDNTVIVGTSDDIKMTTDGGATWTVNFTPSLTGNQFGRVAVTGTKAIYTSAYDVIYASDYTSSNWVTVVSNQSQDQSKYTVTVGEDGKFYLQGMDGQIKVYDEANNTLSNYGTTPPDYTPQGGFNQTLIVKNNIILSGEVNAKSSSDNGSTWYNSLNGYWGGQGSDGLYVHSDHHGMGQLDGNYEFWTANDGGLAYVDYGSDPANQKPTITYKSEKVIVTQVYSVSINPSANDDAYMMANQDNDTFSKKNGNWYSVATGDGIQSAINYNNTNIRYAADQGGNIEQSDTAFEGQLNGNGKTVKVEGAYFAFPFEMNKTDPNIIYAGGDEVYKIVAGTTLTISNLNSGAGTVGQQSSIKTIATHGNSILAAGDNGVRFSTDGGVNWLTKTPPAGTVNSVDFDANDNNIMYLSISGYTNGNKIYKSTDGGANFTNISGDLPNIVMKEVLFKQNQNSEYLFAATELGVYFTSNGGTNWKRLGNGMPMVDVKDIDIHYTNDKLVAATFGRGLWEINIASATLSIKDDINPIKALSIYPNPASNILNLSLNANNDYNYLIYNVIGGVVKKGKLASNKINVSGLAKNVYILKVYNESETFSSKFIKKNN